MRLSNFKRYLVATWLLLIPFEMGAIFLSYWTLGWSEAVTLFRGFFVTNFLGLLLYLVHFRIGLLLGIIYGLVILGYQTPLGLKWYYIHTEANRIVEWVYAEQIRSGSYPQDLSAYQFNNSEYKEYLSYGTSDNSVMPFGVSYHIGTPNTYHWYQPQCGWVYIDD